VRVDKWLWAVRVFKTRRQATDACTSGRIRINGEVAKPASKVKVGDIVQAARRDRTIVFVANELLEKRVSAPLAAAAVEFSHPLCTLNGPTCTIAFRRQASARIWSSYQVGQTCGNPGLAAFNCTRSLCVIRLSKKATFQLQIGS